MKVLLVEDEPDLGASVVRKLSHERYIVDWVLDGNEAWSCLEDHWTQYTLAIFDWLLPGISGLELCKRLRVSARGTRVDLDWNWRSQQHWYQIVEYLLLQGLHACY